LSPEDDGAVAVQQDAVLGVPPYSAGERDPLGVAADGRQVLRALRADSGSRVTSSSRTGGGEGSRRAIRSTKLSRPKPVTKTVAPSCCATRAT
jgi:hypothetical protein